MMWIEMSEQLPPMDHEVLFYLPYYKAAYRGMLCMEGISMDSYQEVETLCVKIYFSYPARKKDLETHNRDLNLNIASLWTEIPKITKNKLKDEPTRFELMDIE